MKPSLRLFPITIRRFVGQASVAMLMSAAVLGCKPEKSAAPTVVIDGSSTVFPITDYVARQFEKRNPVKVTVRVPVGISGTHGGFLKFCAGEADIANASRPINRAEVELCAKNKIEFIEMPIGYDGLAVLVNPKNSWANDLTTTELKRIWEPGAERQIMKWSQVRDGWPDRELHLYGAGRDSGTYDYFTQAIVQKEHSSRADFRSSEDDNELVNDVAKDELALGFFGYAYLQKDADRLKAVAIDDGDPSNGAGPIAPSPETVRNATYQPLSRPLFIYVSKSALKRREVELFVGFFLSKAASYVERVGYVPLPEAAYRVVHERVIARQFGSVFDGGGAQVGLSIDQLLQKEGVR
jgi:phosphate transport system substrate-binding protein